MDDKLLLSLKEVCKLTGVGETKMREILKKNDGKFTVNVGNRLYVNRKIFQEYLDKCAKYQIKI